MSELYSDRIKRAGTAIRNAEKLVIGAGAGLSAAAGIDYNGKRFTENFKPFIEKYGMKDQCAKGCHDSLYYNEQIVVQMISETTDCRIPSFLVPQCPVCGGNMEVNLRKDNNFVQDSKWFTSESNYRKFISGTEGKSTVFLELGVGFNTPGIIRYPFEAMVHDNPDALLIRINRDHMNGKSENLGSTISFDEDMTKVIYDIRYY